MDLNVRFDFCSYFKVDFFSYFGFCVFHSTKNDLIFSFDAREIGSLIQLQRKSLNFKKHKMDCSSLKGKMASFV